MAKKQTSWKYTVVYDNGNSATHNDTQYPRPQIILSFLRATDPEDVSFKMIHWNGKFRTMIHKTNGRDEKGTLMRKNELIERAYNKNKHRLLQVRDIRGPVIVLNNFRMTEHQFRDYACS